MNQAKRPPRFRDGTALEVGQAATADGFQNSEHSLQLQRNATGFRHISEVLDSFFAEQARLWAAWQGVDLDELARLLDDEDTERADHISELPWAEARRGYKRPVLSREEQRRADNINFDDPDPSGMFVAGWNGMTPEDRQKARAFINGEALA